MGYSRFFHLRKEQAARLLKQQFEVNGDKLRCVAASLGVGHSVYIELSEYEFRDEVLKTPGVEFASGTLGTQAEITGALHYGSLVTKANKILDALSKYEE